MNPTRSQLQQWARARTKALKANRNRLKANKAKNRRRASYWQKMMKRGFRRMATAELSGWGRVITATESCNAAKEARKLNQEERRR